MKKTCKIMIEKNEKYALIRHDTRANQPSGMTDNSKLYHNLELFDEGLMLDNFD